MDGFKYFFEQTAEQEENIKKTLDKLPKKHSDLIKGYKFKWQCDNVLDGDNAHVGILNPNNKTITVCAPWNYGREFTFLHEVSHKVWEKYIAPYPEKIKEWQKVMVKHKGRMKQNAEELWCMNYANYFVKNKIITHTYPEWEAYMKKFVRITC